MVFREKLVFGSVHLADAPNEPGVNRVNMSRKQSSSVVSQRFIIPEAKHLMALDPQ